MTEPTDNTSAFVAALRRGDVAAAAASYAEDAVLLAPASEMIRGRAAIAAYWRAGLDSGVDDVEFVAAEQRRHDGLAYEAGRYQVRLRAAEGGDVVDRGNYVLVHRREADGSWQYDLEMFSPDTTAGKDQR